jgi:DNA-binding transcriptional MerR regulator
MPKQPDDCPPTLTIGQLADYVGVTIRAIRHYHQRGLLAEPPRDASDYRRYNAQDVIELVRIKTLAEAGVPLSRVKDLLSADSDSLVTAVTEIQQSLDDHIGQLQRHRDQIAHLTAGDRLYVPADIADLLDRLRSIGVDEQTVQRERDGWILLAAAAPLHVRVWAKEKTASLDDVEFQRLYLAFDQAQEWSPDDPRLEQLADDLTSYLGIHQLRELDTQPPPEIPATAIAMIASTTGPQAESHQRLLELVHERAQRRMQADAT